MPLEIVPLTDPETFKREFVPILSHWNKQKVVRFIPFYYLYKELNQGNLYLLVDRGQTVGILWLTYRKRPYPFLQIEVLAVSPDHLRKGYGSQCCQMLTNHFGHDHQQDVELKVERNNRPAIKFYQQNGFGVIDRFTTKGGVDTYKMRYA